MGEIIDQRYPICQRQTGLRLALYGSNQMHSFKATYRGTWMSLTAIWSTFSYFAAETDGIPLRNTRLGN
jgi:hypothetical protein